MHACKSDINNKKNKKKGKEEEENYPPRYIFSANMNEPMMATMIIIKGLKAVAKTGPFFFITNPWT